MKTKEVMTKNKVLNTLYKAGIMLNFAILSSGTALCNEGGWGAAGTVELNTNMTDPGKAIGGLISVILTLAMYVGIALGAWGGVMFGLAVKNEEPESKQKALMTVIAGVVLLSLKLILSSIGLINK